MRSTDLDAHRKCQPTREQLEALARELYRAVVAMRPAVEAMRDIARLDIADRALALAERPYGESERPYLQRALPSDAG